MNHLTLTIPIALLWCTLVPSISCAQDVPPVRFTYTQPEETPSIENGIPTSWRVQFEPMVRYVGPAGDLRLPGPTRGDKVDLADLNLNGPRLMPGYDLSFRSGSWRLNTIGLFYEVETQIASAEDAFTLGPLAVLPGQRTSADLTYTQLDFRIARTVLDTPLSPLSEGPGHKVRVRVDAELGLRLYDFEFRFENLDTGDRTSYGRTFYEPHVGAKAAFNIHERATIDLYTNFGYWPFDREAFSWDIGVGFQWRPVENVGLQIGYRSTIFLLQEGSGAGKFEWAGSFQGLNAGIQIRF